MAQSPSSMDEYKIDEFAENMFDWYEEKSCS